MNFEIILYSTTKRVHIRFVLEHLITVLFTFPGFTIVSVTVVFHREFVFTDRMAGPGRRLQELYMVCFFARWFAGHILVEMQPSHKAHHRAASDLPLVRLLVFQWVLLHDWPSSPSQQRWFLLAEEGCIGQAREVAIHAVFERNEIRKFE